MNRNLLYSAIFLVLLGIGFDFYPLSLLGLFLMIPALLSSSRLPPPRAPETPKREARRIVPLPPTPPPAAAAPAPQSSVMVPTASTTQLQGFPPTLFPTTMFPSLSQMGTQAQPVVEHAARKPEERDELVEVGAILVLLKLAFG